MLLLVRIYISSTRTIFDSLINENRPGPNFIIKRQGHPAQAADAARIRVLRTTVRNGCFQATRCAYVATANESAPTIAANRVRKPKLEKGMTSSAETANPQTPLHGWRRARQGKQSWGPSRQPPICLTKPGTRKKSSPTPSTSGRTEFRVPPQCCTPIDLITMV